MFQNALFGHFFEFLLVEKLDQFFKRYVKSEVFNDIVGMRLNHGVLFYLQTDVTNQSVAFDNHHWDVGIPK